MDRQVTRVNARSQVRARFTVVREMGDELIVSCPSPDHEDRNPSASINVRKRLWTCYSCGASGTLEELLGGRVADPDVDDLLTGILDDLDHQDPRHHPESWLDQFDVAGVHPYWRSRRLPDRLCREFRLGYDPNTARATIPLRDPSGAVLGVIGRATQEDQLPRYLYPVLSISRTMFGYHRVRRGGMDDIVITEGALDAIAMIEAGHDAVAQLGSSLSDEQVELVKALGTATITLAYDQDPAGRRATSKVLGHYGLYNHQLRVMRWDRLLGKDPLDLDVEDRQKAWRKARPAW